MADSSSLDVNIVTDAVDSTGATVIGVVQSNVTESSTVDALVTTGGIGPTGATGSPGTAATIAVGTVTTGSAGSSATVTNSGSSSAAVFDFTIPRGDTGSSSTGITRSTVVTSGNTTASATASVDYVYLVAGAHTITMPTAVGNTNRYTIKNNHSAAITVNTTSSQTIDGTTSIQIAPEDSVDLISNNSNWGIL